MSSQHTPAVVSTMSVVGLGITRSLGRKGVPVFMVDPDLHQIGMNSRRGRPRVSPDPSRSPEDYLGFLLELGRELGGRPVLYPTGDRTVLLYSKHRDALAEHFRFQMPAPELVEAVVSKDGLDSLARRHGIPAPRTFSPRDLAEAERAAHLIEYPALIKPIISPSWSRPAIAAIVGPEQKVVVAADAATLLAFYRRIAAVDPQMVFQELIPGEDSRLHYVCMYCDQRGEPVAGFAGQKVRIFPVHFGSASYVRTVHDPALIEAAKLVVRRFGYQGLCGIEFKRDPRDGRYKLIEFNARFGLWDMMGEELGVDLADYAYRSLLGERLPPNWSYPAGVTWVSFTRDLGAVRTYLREGALTRGRWVATVLGARTHSVLAVDDPAPFLSSTVELVGSALRRRSVQAIKRAPLVARLTATPAYRHLRHRLVLAFARRENRSFTQFMRLPTQYAALTGPVLDRLLSPGRDRRLRIVVVGCANGAEPYSIATAILAARPGLDFAIDAYDIDEAQLARARHATYSVDEVRDNPLLPPGFEEKAFEARGGLLRVRPEIAGRASFGTADALAPRLAGRIGRADIVFAQNFLYHLRPRAARRAFANLVALLNPRAAMFVDGMDLGLRQRLTQAHGLRPLLFGLETIHAEAREGRGSAYPYVYYGLEPFRTVEDGWQNRYATIFLRG